MKKRCPKRVNPETMITRFEEIFKSVGLKKPTARNLLLVLIATEKLFLLLLLSNAFSRIYGTNTFLFPFYPETQQR